MKFTLFFILLALSAFFSSAETAFFSIRQSQIRLMQEKKKKNAELIYKLKSHPERLLITLLIGNNIVNFSAASYATILGIEFSGSFGVGLATGIATLLILVFGEILPKSVAFAHNTRLARNIAKPVYFFYTIFYPLAWLLLKLDYALNTFLKVRPQTIVSEEEIRVMSRLGAEHGAIDQSEHDMIENIFKFDDVRVRDIMTPMTKVEMLHGDVRIEHIAHFVSQSGYSRFPVDDDGEIIGYIHVNQIMRALNSDEREKTVAEFASPMKTIDENMTVDRVFLSMKKSKAHLYSVHAEKDKKDIMGIVTMEDVLEEIVGDIEDETDE